jgi:hypothetical protein
LTRSSYNGKIYYQIQAIRNFTHYTYVSDGFSSGSVEEIKEIKRGNVGGYIENESCLSHEGNCWIDYGSFVSDGIRISGNAWVDKFITINGFNKMKLDIYDNVRVSANIFNESISNLEKTCSIGGYTKINALIYIEDSFEISSYNIDINNNLVLKKRLGTQYDNELIFRSQIDIENYRRTMSEIENGRYRNNISYTNRFYGDNNSNQEFAFDFRYIKPNLKISSAESKPKEEPIKPTIKNALDYIEIR